MLDLNAVTTKYHGLKDMSELTKALATELHNTFPPERFKKQFKSFSEDVFYVFMATEMIERCPKDLKLEIAEGKISIQKVEEKTPEGFDGFVAEASKINLTSDAPPSLQEFLNARIEKTSYNLFIDL